MYIWPVISTFVTTRHPIIVNFLVFEKTQTVRFPSPVPAPLSKSQECSVIEAN